MNRIDLDQEIARSLSESVPEASSLNLAHLRQHDRALRRQERLLAGYETGALHISNSLYRILSVLAALLLILILLWGVMDLPGFGNESSPTENEVAERYLAEGLQEGGATNLVANMILDYRAFDTLGESNVLFASVCTVIMLLGRFRAANKTLLQTKFEVVQRKQDPVLIFGAKILCPVILLFGLYIILNGHLGPGGGFSGGAVMGAALILYRSAFGTEQIGQAFSFRLFQRITLFALAFYALSKAYSFFTGANGLPSFISVGVPGAILSAGLILPLNIAVGIIVCCTMYAFFALFEKGDF